MKATCTVKFGFSAAKRLINFEGKCNQLHGYHHVIEATFTNETNADYGVDFYELKEKIQHWLDENLDHTVILNENDKALGNAISAVTGQTIYYLPTDPTAERIAEHLKEAIFQDIIEESICTKLRLYDHESAWVEL